MPGVIIIQQAPAVRRALRSRDVDDDADDADDNVDDGDDNGDEDDGGDGSRSREASVLPWADGPASLAHTSSAARGSEVMSSWGFCVMARDRDGGECGVQVKEEGITFLVPYADLANHSLTPNARFDYNEADSCFELRSLAPISAGNEVCLSDVAACQGCI